MAAAKSRVEARSGSEIRLVPPPRIAPVLSVSPPAAAAGPRVASLAGLTTMRKSRASIGSGAVAGLGALAALAIAVFAWLPGRVPTVAQDTTAGSRSARSEPAPAPRPPIPVEARLDTAVHQIAELRTSLEERGVASWGGDEYATALAFAAKGDERLGVRDRAAAAVAYEQALARLESVDARAASALEVAISEGQKTLAAGDHRAAERDFGLAASIVPGEPRAIRGLKRAQAFEDVAARLAAGAELEERGDREGAIRAFRQAAAVDPEATQPRRELARIQSQAANDAFAAAMSEGLESLERGDFKAARAAFQRAASIRPGAPLPREGLARADSGERRAVITGHGEAARASESREEWGAAARVYEAVLKLDPTIAFAREGHSRSLQRERMASRLGFYIRRADRLSTPAVHAEASRYLAQAKAVVAPGPRHLKQVAQLAERLVAAAATVRVLLVSDDATDVTVSTVGSLGAFKSRALDLRPGTYAVIGTGRGCRDVRHTLIITPGTTPKPVVVRCQEAF